MRIKEVGDIKDGLYLVKNENIISIIIISNIAQTRVKGIGFSKKLLYSNIANIDKFELPSWAYRHEYMDNNTYEIIHKINDYSILFLTALYNLKKVRYYV